MNNKDYASQPMVFWIHGKIRLVRFRYVNEGDYRYILEEEKKDCDLANGIEGVNVLKEKEHK